MINCNLQRLDGPVRGNGKIIQELEAVFRGAGWNVIKVIWGTGWDELLARDTEGHLVNKMNKTLDGDYQRLRAEDGAYIHEHFFGPEPELQALVEDWTDDQIWALRRGGLDFRKIYSAYRAATELTGAPTVILAKTIKGWTLGPDVEGRNATHQIKELTNKQLLVLRTRLNLEEDIPEEALAGRSGSALLPAGRRHPRVPVPDGAAQGAPRVAPFAGGAEQVTTHASRGGNVLRGARRERQGRSLDHDGLHPAAARSRQERSIRAASDPHRPR